MKRRTFVAGGLAAAAGLITRQRLTSDATVDEYLLGEGKISLESVSFRTGTFPVELPGGGDDFIRNYLVENDQLYKEGNKWYYYHVPVEHDPGHCQLAVFTQRWDKNYMGLATTPRKMSDRYLHLDYAVYFGHNEETGLWRKGTIYHVNVGDEQVVKDTIYRTIFENSDGANDG